MISIVDIEEEVFGPVSIVNETTDGSPEEQARSLHDAALSLQPDLTAIHGELDSLVGCASQSNVKKWETALAKSLRPEILRDRPWFTIRHVRDFLRFRSRIDSCDQIFQIFEFMASAQKDGGISIVKIDWDKFFRPKAFGWRMIAIDFRLLPSKYLCEYYFTFSDLVDINDRILHELFENWRGTDLDNLPLYKLGHRHIEEKIAHTTNFSWFVDSLARDSGAFSAGVPQATKSFPILGENSIAQAKLSLSNNLQEVMTRLESALSGSVLS